MRIISYLGANLLFPGCGSGNFILTYAFVGMGLKFVYLFFIRMKIMKKLLLRSCALGAILAFSALGAQAASFDAGVFSDLGDGFTTSGLSGNFLDTYSFTVEDPNLSIKIEGTHEGMAGNDLLLTNVNSGAQYHLGENFSQAL
ncbi:MAG: hypothetical protein P8179_04765, partial [Candidatus Thiodiazotropha sp.]